MKNKIYLLSIVLLAAISFSLVQNPAYGQKKSTGKTTKVGEEPKASSIPEGEMDLYLQQATQIVKFLESTLNFIADKQNTVKEKETIINESYLKFFWDSEEQALDYILKPAGLIFEKFREVGVISGSKQYGKYEKSGFNTPSGKVELYSSQLEKWGFDPLPVYHEPPESPYSEPELAKEYPLVFTDWKLPPYQHSGGRQINTLRRNHPEPLVVINTGTAKKLGIKNGDQVYIETKRGRIKQKASLSNEIDPRVVLPEFGWWFPEKESELHGWAESNINVLTDNKPPLSREMGTVSMRGILCKVYKA